MAEKVVKENKKSFDLKNLILNGGIYLVLLLLLVLIVMKDPTFLSLLNIQNILTQSSVRIIIAFVSRKTGWYGGTCIGNITSGYDKRK